MIKIISGADVHLHPELFDEVFALRHKVFVDEMGWEELRSEAGRESDQFDNKYAVHQVAVRDGKVAGYQRLLPTIRPHLLSTVLASLCAERPPSGPSVWEVSRYCVAPAHREGRRAVGTIGSELIAATVEWAMSSGVSRLLYEFETSWIGRAIQLGFRVRSLGFPAKIANQTVVAAELIHAPSTLATIREWRGHHEPVVELVGSMAIEPAIAWAS